MILSRRAPADVAEACDWYDRRSPGLGAEFLAAVTSAVRRIDSTTTAFPVLLDEARRLNLHQYPYGVWYVVDPEPMVIAVFHHRRSQDRLRGRIS